MHERTALTAKISINNHMKNYIRKSESSKKSQ